MAKVKHIVLVKFKTGTPEEQVQKLFDEILDTTESIPGIEDYVAGPNISPEGMSLGCSHGFIITFTDVAARDQYLAHADQKRVRDLLSADAETQIVFDFEI